MAWPDVPPWTACDREPDYAASREIEALFRRLAKLQADDINAQVKNDGETRFVTFAAAAQERFNNWRDRLERRLRDEADESPIFIQHLSKYRSLMPALALLFHVIERAFEPATFGEVCDDCAKRAVNWCEYLEGHARRVYSAIVEPEQRALELLAAKLPSPFTIHVIKQKHWSGLSGQSDDILKQALERLQRADWVRVFERKTAGRSTVDYEVNPKLNPKR
jgi:hypothetical protein